MTSRFLVLALSAALALLLCLFVGVERVHREHGDTDYLFFAKQALTTQVVFDNPVKCGECDLRAWDGLDAEDRQQFAAYCAARFGLDDLQPCYAIFEVQQRSASKRPSEPTR